MTDAISMLLPMYQPYPFISVVSAEQAFRNRGKLMRDGNSGSRIRSFAWASSISLPYVTSVFLVTGQLFDNSAMKHVAPSVKTCCSCFTRRHLARNGNGDEDSTLRRLRAILRAFYRMQGTVPFRFPLLVARTTSCERRDGCWANKETSSQDHMNIQIISFLI